MTNTELLTLAQHRVAFIWSDLGKYYNGRLTLSMPTVTLNNRLKTTAGYSYYLERRVEFSTSLFNEYPHEFIKQVIPHEVIHQVAWDIYREGNHGPDWKYIMRVFGIPPDTYHDLTNTVWEAQKAARRK